MLSKEMRAEQDAKRIATESTSALDAIDKVIEELHNQIGLLTGIIDSLYTVICARLRNEDRITHVTPRDK